MDEKHPPNEKKVHFRLNTLSGGRETRNWILAITLVSFVLAALLELVSTKLQNMHIIVAFTVVLIIIFVSIIFDTIGTAVTAADETPFHAMASRKLYAARQAIRLIRNADKVSNFCNDVVGDICGVISGACGTYIVIKVIQITGSRITIENTIINLIVTGFIASLTVGGKATGKTIAIRNSNYIVYKVSVILKFITIKLSFLRFKKNRKKNTKKNRMKT